MAAEERAKVQLSPDHPLVKSSATCFDSIIKHVMEQAAKLDLEPALLALIEADWRARFAETNAYPLEQDASDHRQHLSTDVFQPLSAVQLMSPAARASGIPPASLGKRHPKPVDMRVQKALARQKREQERRVKRKDRQAFNALSEAVFEGEVKRFPEDPTQISSLWCTIDDLEYRKDKNYWHMQASGCLLRGLHQDLVLGDLTCQLSMNQLTDEEFTAEDIAIMDAMHEPEDVDGRSKDQLLWDEVQSGQRLELASVMTAPNSMQEASDTVHEKES